MGTVAERGVSPAARSVQHAVLETLVDASSDAMFSLDTEGRVATWNLSAARILGHEADEIIGQHWTNLFPVTQHEALRVTFDTFGTGNQLDRYEADIERRDGMAIPVSLSVRPVLDEHGSLVGVAAVARDLTEQRLNQEMLGEAEARLQEGEALAHVGRWLWDVATGAVQWSDEFHRIHGVDPLEFEGTFDAHVAPVHAQDRRSVQATLEGAAESGRAVEIDYRVIRPDGEVRRISTRAEPTFNVSGDVIGLRGIGRDVTN